MPASISNPADAVNAALRVLGRTERVGQLYDGSAAGKAFLDVYGQTRDALLRSKSWSFAQQQVNLTAASAVAPAGWRYIYMWPANCLLVRAILPSPFALPDFDPKDVLFTPYQDPALGRTILTTISPATALYTARVTDPAQWDVGFTSAFIGDLAAVVKMGLARDPNMIKEIDVDAAQSLSSALGGSELQPPLDAVSAGR